MGNDTLSSDTSEPWARGRGGAELSADCDREGGGQRRDVPQALGRGQSFSTRGDSWVVSEEVRLVEKGDLDGGSSKSQGWNRRKGLSTGHSPVAGGQGPRQGRFCSAEQGRGRPGPGSESERWVTCPFWTDCFRPLPLPPASSDFSLSLLVSGLFLAPD